MIARQLNCKKHGLPVLHAIGCHVCDQEARATRHVGRLRVGSLREECLGCVNWTICQEIYNQDMWTDAGCPYFKLKIDHQNKPALPNTALG